MSPSPQTGVVDGSGRVSRTGVNSGTAKIKIMYVHNARWSKEEAKVGEKVKMMADIEGIDAGKPAEFTIWRKNADGGDYPVEKITAKTKGGSVEAEWEFKLPPSDTESEIAEGEEPDDADDEEDDDIESASGGGDDNEDDDSDDDTSEHTESSSDAEPTTPSDEEQDDNDDVEHTGGVEGVGAPNAFDLPRFYFFVKVESAPAARSKILSLQDWIEIKLENADDEPIAGAEYHMILSNGQVRSGKLDDNGKAREEDLPPGDHRVVFPEHQDADD